MNKLKIFSSFDLKVIAFITMIIDHIGCFFYYSMSYEKYYMLRAVGRISMPIFAFLIFQGFKHTSNLKKYITRVFLLASITQILNIILGLSVKHLVPNYQIEFYKTFNSVFSFAIGLIILYLLDKVIEKRKEIKLMDFILSIFGIVLLFSLFFIFEVDYGILVPILLICFYTYNILLEKPDSIIDSKKNKSINIILKAFFIMLGVIIVGIFSKNIESFGIIALIVILLYNGKKGKNLGRLFYLLYPLQYLVLCVLGVMFYI